MATPGGTMFSLDRGTGARNWLSPVGDGAHYQSISAADGVVWTVDGASNLAGGLSYVSAPGYVIAYRTG